MTETTDDARTVWLVFASSEMLMRVFASEAAATKWALDHANEETGDGAVMRGHVVRQKVRGHLLCHIEPWEVRDD